MEKTIGALVWRRCNLKEVALEADWLTQRRGLLRTYSHELTLRFNSNTGNMQVNAFKGFRKANHRLLADKVQQ